MERDVAEAQKKEEKVIDKSEEFDQLRQEQYHLREEIQMEHKKLMLVERQERNLISEISQIKQNLETQKTKQYRVDKDERTLRDEIQFAKEKNLSILRNMTQGYEKELGELKEFLEKKKEDHEIHEREFKKFSRDLEEIRRDLESETKLRLESQRYEREITEKLGNFERNFSEMIPREIKNSERRRIRVICGTCSFEGVVKTIFGG